LKSSVTCPFVFNFDYLLFIIIIIIIKFGITGCYRTTLVSYYSYSHPAGGAHEGEKNTRRLNYVDFLKIWL